MKQVKSERKCRVDSNQMKRKEGTQKINGLSKRFNIV